MDEFRVEAEWFRGLGRVATLDEWDAYPDYPNFTDAASIVRTELGLPGIPEPDVALCDGVAG